MYYNRRGLDKIKEYTWIFTRLYETKHYETKIRKRIGGYYADVRHAL